MAIKPKEVQITLRIPGELAKALDKHAEGTRTTRSWVIRDALHRYFDGINGNSSGNGSGGNKNSRT
jgi:metal-responsive CopG/Arc/MetJ family transcriptional regulator